MELHIVRSKSKIHWYFFNCDHISTYLQITMGFRVLHYETPTFFIMCIIFGMIPNSHFCFTFIISNILWFEDFFFRSWFHHVALNLAKHDYVHTLGDMCVTSLCAKQHMPSTLVDPMDHMDNDLLKPSIGSLLWFNSVNHLVKTRGKWIQQ
jgi:hypothetical protein